MGNQRTAHSGAARELRNSGLLLGFSFFIGALAAFFICRGAGSSEELSDYLHSYGAALSGGATPVSASILGVAGAYYVFPGLVFLAGFGRRPIRSSAVLFCCAGFLMAYAVESFSIALGKSGVLVALCLFGLRFLFVIPCALFLALFRREAVSAQSGRANHSGVSRRKTRFLFLWPAILALGVMAELTFVPKLAAVVLQNLS